MGKILIIGVGSAGVNTVKHMREVGIPNAEYITMGDFEDKVSVIPHYNLNRDEWIGEPTQWSDSRELERVC